MFETLGDILSRFYFRFTDYLPNLFGGIIIFIFGLLLANIIRRLLFSLFSFFQVSSLLQKAGLMEKAEIHVWQQVIGEILRWTIIIIFLIPTLEVLNLSRATVVINQLLTYLPNVLISVIISFVGLIFANLSSDLINHSFGSNNKKIAKPLAILAKSAIIFFTILIVMTQLGVAQDLIKILFTGIIAMLSLAGGIAFGLGGRDVAKKLLNNVIKNIRN